MKKIFTLAVTLLLAASLSFAQATGGTTDSTAKTGKTTTGKKGATTKTKTAGKKGAKSKKSSGGTTTTQPPK